MDKNRELIEEFLGKDHPLVRTMSAPDYENSYLWIMPVYQKIVQVMYADYCESRQEEVLDEFFPRVVFVEPNLVYHAVIAFLKWYKLEQITKS